MEGVLRPWFMLIGTNILLVCFFAHAILSPTSPTQTVMLPGTTTHGHYQIEMKCNVCHAEGLAGVKQDACLSCHAEELDLAKDTHPAIKFNDPTNAERLEILDAQNCITCHKEHVEEQTLEMGLTMPSDYCYHCHQETLETRPSHANFAFDSCATAGCHNYHDNRALYENFLHKHAAEEDFLEQAVTLALASIESEAGVSLELKEADHPAELKFEPSILNDWVSTTHAIAGVNCSGCHEVVIKSETGDATESQPSWSNTVSHEACSNCHESQTDGFLAGRHGMRLANDLPAMTPGEARLKMHKDVNHKQLDCMACHSDHRFDTQFAAVDACLSCHNDMHSLAFKESSHFSLYEQELNGELPVGSGVTCATCHMPRIENDSGFVHVEHNQNNNLRPNEKMIREVCMNCHGLSFSIDALADPELAADCYSSAPSTHIESVDLAKAWFEEKERKRQERMNRNKKSL